MLRRSYADIMMAPITLSFFAMLLMPAACAKQSAIGAAIATRCYARRYLRLLCVTSAPMRGLKFILRCLMRRCYAMLRACRHKAPRRQRYAYFASAAALLRAFCLL